jgi:hypothetical protein
MKKTIIIIVIALAVIGGGVLLMMHSNNNAPANPNATGGVNFNAIPGDAELLNNLRQAGLDALNTEGAVLHIHQHLDLIINGQNIAVPADIGIGSNFISPIHTHDTAGILHVESPIQKEFKLAQFFTEWGITFSDTCIGSNCADSGHKLVVAVNGIPAPSVADIVLHSHDEIEIWYGNKNDTPNLIKNFAFPAGL